MFKRDATVYIIVRNTDGKEIDREYVSFSFHPPKFSYSKLFRTKGYTFLAAACVCPGCDPRGIERKDC
jgi:hypothetical protein